MEDRYTTEQPIVPGKQRAELTFRHNVALGRHGWLRLTPAYSVKVVEDLLARHGSPVRVFEPFSGTGTTPLCAAMRGHSAVAVEINPFLVWLGRAKLARYDASALANARSAAEEAVRIVKGGLASPVAPPPIFNIERWWDEEHLSLLCELMGAIGSVCSEEGPARDLLLIAFCRTMIAVSNAAFNHQSMSFKDDGARSQRKLFDVDAREEGANRYVTDVAFVLAGAAENPAASATIVEGDSRYLPRPFEGGAELLITSPPYPNRMSYIRELRPYMYWLGYLRESREAGELDWRAIGGTWGAATSRVAEWRKAPDTYFPDILPGILERIGSADAKSGAVLACYVGRYFEDIWNHVRSAVPAMSHGGEMHYVVGNSKFYDVIVPVELIYRDMLLEAGARRADVVPLRKRNSKKELVEFDVVAAT